MRWLQKTRWAMMGWQPNPSNFRFPKAKAIGSLGRITCNAPLVIRPFLCHQRISGGTINRPANAHSATAPEYHNPT